MTKQEIINYMYDNHVQGDFKIEEMAEDLSQPEIIRCKDCKWWDKQEMSLQGRCGLFQMYPTGEWYCGNAKLRGDSE